MNIATDILSGALLAVGKNGWFVQQRIVSVSVCVCVYVFIYIYMCIYT